MCLLIHQHLFHGQCDAVIRLGNSYICVSVCVCVFICYIVRTNLCMLLAMSRHWLVLTVSNVCFRNKNCFMVWVGFGVNLKSGRCSEIHVNESPDNDMSTRMYVCVCVCVYLMAASETLVLPSVLQLPPPSLPARSVPRLALNKNAQKQHRFILGARQRYIYVLNIKKNGEFTSIFI